MATSKCVGIDLGTTNSVIAMMAEDNKNIICLTTKAGRKTFPSAIVYDRKSKGVKAGQIAFNRRGTVPEPIISVKSHMGDANYTVSSGPLTMSPIEVSAEILKEMKAQMENYLHGFPEYEDYVVDRAVITIPAYFASNAREATTRAGELAGFNVEFTLQEPTAAALFYCFKNGIENGIFMVYDLGGGTFDVSIVRLDEGDAYVLGIAGNNYLGGDNFDDALARHLLQELIDSDEGYDLEDMDIYHDDDDKRRFTRLKLNAEVIKKALSSQEEFFESTDGVFEDKSGAKVNLAVTVTREEFEDLIRPLIESTLDECHKALREAEEQHGVTLEMIDGVLLVGGSTHIPMVAEIIEENFTSPSLPVHTKMPKPLIDEPDMAVGYGAAIAAATTGTVHGGSVQHGGRTVTLSAAFKPAIGYCGISMVEGSISAEGGSLPDGIYASVSRDAGGCRKEYMVNADGSFVFDELVSEKEKELYSCEFIADGKMVLRTTFDAALTGGGGVPPVVLSRNYYIETVNEMTGATKMVKLMSKGTQLPCSQDYKFTTNSANPYFLRLRFFEESDFLKQVVMNFNKPAAPGTVINMSMSCDRSSRFTVRAEGAGVVVDAVLEPSPAPDLPEKDDIDSFLDDVRSKVALIPEAGQRVVAEKKFRRTASDLQDAAEAGDAYKAKDLMNALEEMVRGNTKAALVPAREEFDARVISLQQKNKSSDKGDDETGKEIARTAAKGYKAYDNEDQAMLTSACRELDEFEALLEEDHDPGQGQPPMWMICAYFAQTITEIIDKYQKDDSLPSNVRRDYDKRAAADVRTCQDIMSSCRFMPSEEECAGYLQSIREIYPIWEKCAKLMDPLSSLPGVP